MLLESTRRSDCGFFRNAGLTNGFRWQQSVQNLGHEVRLFAGAAVVGTVLRGRALWTLHVVFGVALDEKAFELQTRR